METETILSLDEVTTILSDDEFLELLPEVQRAIVKKVASERGISCLEAFNVLLEAEARENIADRSH